MLPERRRTGRPDPVADGRAGSFDAVITNAAGCGSTLKEYGELLEEDDAYAVKAKEFAAKMRDITEFLASIEINRHMGAVNAIMLRATPELIDKYIRPLNSGRLGTSGCGLRGASAASAASSSSAREMSAMSKRMAILAGDSNAPYVSEASTFKHDPLIKVVQWGNGRPGPLVPPERRWTASRAFVSLTLTLSRTSSPATTGDVAWPQNISRGGSGRFHFSSPSRS